MSLFLLPFLLKRTRRERGDDSEYLRLEHDEIVALVVSLEPSCRTIVAHTTTLVVDSFRISFVSVSDLEHLSGAFVDFALSGAGKKIISRFDEFVVARFSTFARLTHYQIPALFLEHLRDYSTSRTHYTTKQNTPSKTHHTTNQSMLLVLLSQLACTSSTPLSNLFYTSNNACVHSLLITTRITRSNVPFSAYSPLPHTDHVISLKKQKQNKNKRLTRKKAGELGQAVLMFVTMENTLLVVGS